MSLKTVNVNHLGHTIVMFPLLGAITPLDIFLSPIFSFFVFLVGMCINSITTYLVKDCGSFSSCKVFRICYCWITHVSRGMHRGIFGGLGRLTLTFSFFADCFSYLWLLITDSTKNSPSLLTTFKK